MAPALQDRHRPAALETESRSSPSPTGAEPIYPRGQKKVRFALSATTRSWPSAAIDYSDLWDQRDEKKTLGDLSQRVKNTVAAMVAELSGRELPQRFMSKETGE